MFTSSIHSKNQSVDISNSKTTEGSDAPVDLFVDLEQVEDSGDGTTSDQQILHGFKLVLCSVSLLLCMFIFALDQTITVTLLETVGNKFNSFGKISWITIGFFLPVAVLSMSWGSISLIFGRKICMLISIVLFEAGSLMCALAPSMNVLIGGRIIAGIGGGGIQTMVFLILTEIVTIEKRGLMISFIGLSFGIASVVAPLIGGALTTHVSWRWCFYINLPIGAAAFFCIALLFNPPKVAGSFKEKIKKVDYIGVLLLAIGLSCLLLPLSFGSSTSPWNSAEVISLFVIGFFGCIAFFIYNFFISKVPLIPRRIAKVAQVVLPCLGLFGCYGALMIGCIFLATFFQVVKGADGMQSGIDILPLILPTILAIIFSGAIVSKKGITKPLAIVGSALSTVGFGLLTLLNENSPSSKRIGYQILAGVGLGLLVQPMTISAQIASPKSNGGVLIATSMVTLFRSLGSILGSSLGQVVLNVVFGNKLNDYGAVVGFTTRDIVNNPGLIAALPEDKIPLAIKAFVEGYRDVMFLGMAFSIIAFLTTPFYTNKRVPIAPKSQD
ncbi:Vba5p [Sugiyamaella lignohabitans]|uniref:Vba5p n=1 Tax=Sugiyamaella lignohabitans TaxID=796027 RepID=A0A167CLM0_9ASCO|nr:Vba5p [Sugiyamaella lignohabitans]ANB11859.1 Vba5p [Sugiyamaella lignohabitans]